MIDGMLVAETDRLTDGQLPFDITFPFISTLAGHAHFAAGAVDGTLDVPNKVEDDHDRLLGEVYQAFVFARHSFHDLDERQLEMAFIEAKQLAASRLFGAELYPNVSVDHNGEFTFSHRSSAGYVDIGVRGEAVMSYHVRNDVNPQETRFDDYDWVDYDVPLQLFDALIALRKHL